MKQLQPMRIVSGRVLLGLAAGFILLSSCDVVVEPDGDQATSVKILQQSYASELTVQQEELRTGVVAGKIGSDSLTAHVLDAMVRQFPPDWNQVRSWQRLGCGFWAAVPLGSDQ